MSFKDLSLMKDKKNASVLFYPYIPKLAWKAIKKRLTTRWIGEGPMVKLFEKKFSEMFLYGKKCIAVGSGTDALHLAYILAGIKKGDEVITSVFTCTATNIPLLYIGAKIKFADIDPKTMNICPNSVEKLITRKTKAIIVVHYGGISCDLEKINKIAKKYKIKVIEDAAQALGGKYKNKIIGNISDFTIFSFQAIKHITTGDGGILVIKDQKLVAKAKRLRWFGIDREKKQKGVWENDIKEVGYKYQMTDLGATVGYLSLLEFNKIINHRKKIYKIYYNILKKNKKIQCLTSANIKEDAAWLFTIIINRKDYLQKRLRKLNIETNQVHFRNDKYSIFKKYAQRSKFKIMNSLENKYLVLPIHHKISCSTATKIANTINNIIN